jgi:hypothetical protein
MRFSQFSLQQRKLYVLRTKTKTRRILFHNGCRIELAFAQADGFGGAAGRRVQGAAI